MQSAILLLALAGAAIAHDGAHGTLTLIESTTVTVYTCTGAAASVCPQATSTDTTSYVVLPPGYMVNTEAPPTGSSSVVTETENTTKVEVPTTVVVSTPVATTPASVYTTTNVTVPVSGNTTTNLSASKSVSYVTSVTDVTPSASGSGATSTPTSPAQGGGSQALIPSVMLGLLAFGISIFV